ncbi:MAG: hypothetical protein AAGB13_02185, partial [Cyanobacteria bacterium P01_F01_bin.33]
MTYSIAVNEGGNPASADAVGASLERLCAASPKLKQAIVNACAHAVLLDGQVEEAELLRAIVIALDCPL